MNPTTLLLIAAGFLLGLVLLGVIVYFAVIVPLGPWLNKREREDAELLEEQRRKEKENKQTLYDLVRFHGLSKKDLRSRMRFL